MALSGKLHHPKQDQVFENGSKRRTATLESPAGPPTAFSKRLELTSPDWAEPGGTFCSWQPSLSKVVPKLFFKSVVA